MLMDTKLIFRYRTFCVIVSLLALLGAGYLFLLPKGSDVRVIWNIPARFFLASLVSSSLLVLSMGFGVLAYLAWHKPAKIQGQLDFLQNRMKPVTVLFVLTLFVYTCVGINVYSTYLPIPRILFVYSQPVLVWLGAFASFGIMLIVFPKVQLYFMAEVIALMFSAAIIRSVQVFLFPLEAYWQTITFGLMSYSLLQVIFIQQGKLKNFFFSFDKHSLGLKDGLWLVGMPLMIVLVIRTIGQMDFIFLVPILFLVCGFQTCLANFFYTALKYVWYLRKPFLLCTSTLLWGVIVAIVLGFYYLALVTNSPIVSYQRHNPLLEYDSAAKGMWYVIPVKNSKLFPLGYARFEDSVSDDLGHYFFAVFGSRLGLVRACAPPFLNLEQAVPASVTTMFQPVFNYTFDALCPEWAQTLPQFYWRIGLVGVLLTAFVFGFFILRDPFVFFLMALIALTAWIGWPASRPGQVEVLIFSIPFIAMIPYVVRHGKLSALLALCFVCGILSGLAGFVRNPSGSAIFVTGSLAIIVFAGVKQKNWLLPVAVLLSFLVGQQIILFMLDGLFIYRDITLHISAPIISISSHASGWNILGGIGGAPLFDEMKPTYHNALDMAHWDAILLLVIYNENPLAMFALRHLWAGPRVANQLFLHYLVLHPAEFFLTTSQKAYQAWNFLLNIPTNWPQVIYLSLMLGTFIASIKHHFMFKQVLNSKVKIDFFESLAVILTLAVVSSIPAILTIPDYFGAIYPAAAVLFLGVILALAYFIFSLIAGPSQEKV
jgi:hypothetical protein